MAEFRCRRSAILSGVLLSIAGLGIAQQPVERIEITGSRLPSLSLEGPSPVTVLTPHEIRFDGLTKVEDVLRRLPLSFGFHQDSSVSNGASGTAQVNLRGLGAYRNLVLVNGRRMNLGSPISLPADLNQVPVGLIQRIEVLTGGASAVYGSDAISGVVNFILNDKFEGLQLIYGHSFYNHSQGNPVSGVVAQRAVTNPSQFIVPNDVASDGDIHNISVLLGGNFADGRGNATVYFDWKKEDAVLQSSRDFSACSLNSGVAFTCGGSPTSFPGRFFLNQGSFTLDRVSGLLRPFSPASDQFNFGPYNYYRRPSDKYGFGAFAHYNVGSDLTAYSELLFHSDRTVAQIAPSGLFIFDASGPNAIRAGNPLLTPQWIQALAASNAANVNPATGLPAPLPFDANNPASIFIGRRNIEGGGRQDDLAHSSFRFVFGLKGEAFRHWNYDVSMQTGRVELKRVYKNDFSNARIGRALNAVTDANGNVVCQSVVDGTDPNCVPYNPWALGGVTAASLQYLQVPGMASGFAQRQVLTTSWTADLGAYDLRLPTARSGASVVIGAERRKDSMELTTDNAFTTGDLAGQGSATIGSKGSLQVGEYFGEFRLPMVEKHAVTDLLQLSASYRYSKYSTDKKTNTYGVGLEWAPVSAYRFRGSYQRAVRVADLFEAFAPQERFVFDLPGDPCGPAMRATLAQCQRSGITAANYGRALLDSPAEGYNALGGGNPKLNPETGDTMTLGLVFQPTRQLGGSIDFWRIKIDGAISFPVPARILNHCVFDNQFCDLVQRDRFGTLWALPEGQIVALARNLGGIVSRGWDIAANYTHGLGRYGKLDVRILGTRVTNQQFEIIKGLGKFDCVGLWADRCGPTPKWRHRIRATWMTPWDVEFAFTWRRIDRLQNAMLRDTTLAATVAPTDLELGRRDYLDIAGAWRINKTFTLSGGVNNLTDKDPPIVSSGFSSNGNTFPGLYDTLGRLVFMNLQTRF